MCRFFATAPKGLNELLREELTTFGAENIKTQPTGATFDGELEVGYRSCLWSRLANRIYLVLLETELPNQEALSSVVQSIDWSQHLDKEGTFAVSFSGQGLGITHSHYGALKIKDGIVDYYREHYQVRPSIDTEVPDIRVHGHLNRNQLTLSLDLSGYSLHQRGYREGIQVEAPLKENVAAAILMRANWPEIARQGGAFYDPMCGSGTFLVEAALMASDTAPGLAKSGEMLLNYWLGHNELLWQNLVDEAEQREQAGLRHLPNIYGSDISHKSLDVARNSIQAAGYDDVIEIKQMAVEQGRKWGDWQPGLIVCNPPYGERLGEEETVKQVYLKLGEYLKAEFVHWKAAVLTCHTELGMFLGIKAKRSHDFFNGAMACRLFRFEIEEEWFRQPALQPKQDLAEQVLQLQPDLANTDNAKMVSNRIRKNMKGLKSWVKQNDISAYRVYDADIPEYALAIDLYDTLESGLWVVVAEYAPPKTVNPTKAKRRLYEAMSVLPSVFNVSPERIVFKVRSQQKGQDQYERLDEQKAFFTIVENQTRLRVNFTDYLDTGIFLDHRQVRQEVAKLAAGKRLLNLFCYTATATAEAVKAGCKSSLSLDMSKTYLYWAKHNFMCNDINEKQHVLQQENVLEWLETATQNPKDLFDVIFLDPPSFSTSKRMEGTLDIQRDHVDLIQKTLKLLSKDGKLIFSTNLRKFKLDKAIFEPDYQIENITQRTMPKDYARNMKIHQAWLFSRQ
ncbi:Ribosomal RNA large subunit methyltransferase K/L [Hydrogenovibrio crunogenus]|uniref:Ribosomal RNA large subunit methyltransferase K/L n=1 Tax=Hydrogenovibrio crunogenus TaxID=39765 RepID=A0A4P7NXK4_9GAMM|nr:bifunctional 23S rRNA (guanine(2069)-N(7))-methyltransferase RlmK/23S rRNA (guanine(2445)-N(2))-methyltransferase RlmL [Hydrogenovibrio crunogenus]QBZ82500.1 Ribosomal RNA large subunit methyltransferase K/L [Hydrogenovibrio crunogenus]